MEKVKDFLRKNWILIVLITIFTFLAIFNVIDNHLSNKTNQFVEQTEIDQWKRHYKDSVGLIYLKIDSVRSDSVRRADSIKTDYHKKRADELQIVVNRQDKTIKKLQGEANTAVSDYENDTTAQSKKCNSAISKLPLS